MNWLGAQSIPTIFVAPIATQLVLNQLKDVLDAFAVLWSARRIASGKAFHLPEEIETDAAGIPMTIYC